MKMKHKVACLLMTVAAAMGLATAQSSKTHYSSAKPRSSHIQTESKPLTPKSAMPAKHKSSGAATGASKTNRSTNAELTRLERQPVKAGNGKGTPAAGTKPSTLGANSKNLGTPRVTK